MKRLFTLFVLFVLFSFQYSLAQVSTYSFTTSSGTYTEITGGTIWGNETNDDISFTAIDLGFTFEYNGASFTQVSINANGFLAMGATVSNSYFAISTGASNNVIVPLNRDLQGQPGAELMTLTEGTSPNQVFVVQWKNYKRWGSTGTGDSYNFQIKLYESTKQVQFVYGIMTNNATATTVQVGLRGSSNADFNNRTTTTDWANSTAGATNDATMALSATIYPASGYTYTFTPSNFPPAITYTPLTNTSSTDNRALNGVVITDSDGIAGGAVAPRVYWRVNAGAWQSAATSSGSSPYDFTIGTSGLSVNDVVEYFVVAQDLLGVVGANPSTGFSATDVNTITSYPTNPNLYLITDTPLSGDYTVGLAMFRQVTGRDIYFETRTRTVTRDINGVDAFNDINAGIYDKENPTELDLNPRYETITESYVEIMEDGRPFDLSFFSSTESRGVYPTITAAVNDLKLRGASGAVTFLLVDTNYPSETYPIDLTAFAGASATNTVTIKPAAGVQAVIPGDATQTTATIRLNTNGQYYIIDGSNTIDGSTRDLTITALGTSPAVHFFSSGDNNIVKNCILQNQNSSTGSGTLILAAGTGSSNNLIDNCLFRPIESATRYGIGVYLFSSFTGVNNTISNCEFVDFNSRAIAIQGALGVDNNDAIGNEIYQVNPSTLTTVYGISISRAPNCDIVGNNIYGLSSTGATPTIAGLYYSGASGVDMTVRAVNNVITFGSLNAAGTIRGIDYWGFSANSFEMYYNTVLLLGDEITGTISTAAVAKRDGAVNFKMVNNTFDNARSNSTGTGSHYAVQLSNAAATLWELNYNNYFVDGTGGVLGIFSTTIALTLAEWQTATTQEANSLNSNPNYVSATDLRLQFPTALYGAGAPVAGITTDILGDLRSASTPTIGAYENPVATIGWANLQWPPSATILAGATVTVFAQIWIDGITNQPGPGAGIQAWIGVSDANTDPSTWTTWIPAVFNVDAGNNDEYMAMIGATLAPGTYYYASRFNVFNGDFVYGGYNAGGGGFWDGINNVSGVLTVDPLILNLWERSVAQANLPTWFGADTERGLAYGFTSDGTEASNHRVYVVSRNAGLNVRILNAENGTDVGTLNVTGISGGAFALNDISVTSDGKIIGGNMTTNASTSPFKLYMWDNELSVPTELLSYTGTNAVRLGDKFTVVGSYAAGTMEIWAASATGTIPVVYKWTMSGGLLNPAQVITLSDAPTTLGSAAVGPIPNGDFWLNANGINPKKYQANGTLVGTVPGAIVATGSNAIRHLGFVGNNEYVATFAYGAGNHNARILEIPLGVPEDALLYAVTPSMGSLANGNGAGDVDFQVNPDFTVNVFVLGTNNGIGAYRSSDVVPVELSTFAANVVDRTVTLSWRTESESNSSGFEVERSSANQSWTQIGFVKSAGTTTEPQNYSFVDSKLETGSYSYRLKMVDLDGSFSYSKAVEVEIGTPMTFALSQNYPNPFNPATRIDYQVPFNANVQIELYSITGERVATLVNTELSAGYYTMDVDASSLRLASGVYFYRMISTDVQGSKFMDTKKMVLLK